LPLATQIANSPCARHCPRYLTVLGAAEAGLARTGLAANAIDAIVASSALAIFMGLLESVAHRTRP
jgi:hypothetical protein